jgi:hypothetical protein
MRSYPAGDRWHPKLGAAMDYDGAGYFAFAKDVLLQASPR